MHVLANLCLLLVSCVAGLLLCEVSLRLFYPKYQHLAEAQFRSDAMRLWARTPNARSWRGHPDTGLPHLLYHNNLALRQHRDFSETTLAAATNIGLFDGSFLENSRIGVQYSLTEPLDYLLNQGQKRFNVLNFGVDGYGPGQSFLTYESFSGRAWDLDQVLYVYWINDLRDIYLTGLFHLDDAGRLAQVEAAGESWWVPFVRRLHVTYLILDAIGRVSLIAEQAVSTNEHLRREVNDRSAADALSPLLSGFSRGDLNFEHQQILEIFRQLIRRWKNSVEDNGGAFSIVLLPDRAPHPYLVDSIRAEGIETIDLYACFNDSDPAFSQTPWVGGESPYRFKNDPHWNEKGTSLAAVCLYRALEGKMGLPVLSEDRLQEAVSRYYAAFGAHFPLPTDFGGGSASSPEASAEIRKKYMELDLQVLELESEITDLVRQPDKRIIASEFDVYLAGNRLVYVKDNCRRTDVDAQFLLHVAPVDDGDLAVLSRPHGFENLDFHGRSTRINDRQCAFTADLPGWPIRSIRTGQYVPGAGEIWSEEFLMEQAGQAN